MPEKDENLLTTEEYAPRKYSLRRYAITTIKVVLLGGGVVGALWVLDSMILQ